MKQNEKQKRLSSADERTQTFPDPKETDAGTTETPKPKSNTDQSEGGMVRDEHTSDQSQSQNRASVITARSSSNVSIRPDPDADGTTDEEVTIKCTSTLQVRTEPSLAAESPRHRGKVIVTRVTLNSLTVTFKEAAAAEGFFSVY